MKSSLRVGIVGAGANTELRHIPGLKAIEGVEIVAVCNRSPASSQKIATKWGIPRIAKNWKELVEDKDVDAVVIGTWPNLHCPVTIAALHAGKHVLCEARMAMNASEAHMMLDASRQNPHLVAMLVPAPFSFAVDKALNQQFADPSFGELLALDLRIQTGNFLDREAPLNWRIDRACSGLNTMFMGVWYESLMRWVGPAKTVCATGKVFQKKRLCPVSGTMKAIEVPEHLDISGELACGALYHMQVSNISGMCKRTEAEFYFEQATVAMDDDFALLIAHKGEDTWEPVDVDPDEQTQWRVEEEFVSAIRGDEKVSLTTFEDGVRYMEFTEAVHLSLSENKTYRLPLAAYL